MAQCLAHARARERPGFNRSTILRVAMADSQRNAFGRLICAPENLPHEQRVEELSRLAGGLLAGNPDPVAGRWMGRAILESLRKGGPIERYLGLIPPPGSHQTARNVARRRQRDGLLVRFALEIGNDKDALRILRGQQPCPERAANTLMELCGYGRLPVAHDAISRARRSIARPL